VAARILADVGDVARFADRNLFASWTGTAPLDASPASRTGAACPGQGTGGSPHDPHRRGRWADVSLDGLRSAVMLLVSTRRPPSRRIVAASGRVPGLSL
jgi:hypothetical protein